MCNYKHIDAKEIPLEGKGWKIFGKTDNGYVSCFGSMKYDKDWDGWIHWAPMYKFDGDGFCFFPTREEARRCLRVLKSGGLSVYYRDRVIKKIEYREGLQEHDENSICKGTYRTCLAKQFRILEG